MNSYAMCSMYWVFWRAVCCWGINIWSLQTTLASRIVCPACKWSGTSVVSYLSGAHIEAYVSLVNANDWGFVRIRINEGMNHHPYSVSQWLVGLVPKTTTSINDRIDGSPQQHKRLGGRKRGHEHDRERNGSYGTPKIDKRAAIDSFCTLFLNLVRYLF